jgi:hypothetical protein
MTMSDNYTQVSTPSTEDVREYFAFNDFHRYHERTPERYELFDQWLAEHDREVVAQTCERLLDVVHDEELLSWYGGQLFISQAVIISSLLATELKEVPNE